MWQCCRSILRASFQDPEDLRLLEREKRAHWCVACVASLSVCVGVRDSNRGVGRASRSYSLELLNDILLSNPPLPCHRTCLAGLRAVLRLLNKAALSSTPLRLGAFVREGGGGAARESSSGGEEDDDDDAVEAAPLYVLRRTGA